MKHTTRVQERLYLTYALRVFENEAFIGFIADITENGVMIISDVPFTEGMKSRLKMVLPSSFVYRGNAEPGRFIEFTATCKWVQQSKTDEDHYISGLEFWDIESESKDVILSLMRECRMK